MTETKHKAKLLAALKGDDLAVVSRVDSLLGLPEGLHRLEPITLRLGDLCRELRDEGWSDAIDDIERFCALARTFLERHDIRGWSKLFSPTSTVSNPFFGILLSHPLYPIFFFSCENPELQPAYWRLLKLMLTSRIREVESHPRSRFEDLDDRELKTLNMACRLIRKLHKYGEESSALLRKIDQCKYPVRLLAWISMGCPMKPDLQNGTYNDMRQLGHYLADCHGLEPVVNERGAKRSRSGSARSSDGVDLSLWDWRKHRTNAEPTDAVERRDTGMELRRLAPEVPETARQDLGEAGLLAAEFHQDTEHWLGILHSDEVEPDDEEEIDSEDSSAGKGEIETGLPSYAKYFTAAKNKAMKFAFDNQRTATRWSRPTLAEYAELISMVESRFEEAYAKANNSLEQPSKREEAERVRDLCLTMGLMVALGRGFDTVHELYVVASEAQWDPETMEVAFLKKENRWLVSTTRLGYRSNPPPEQQRWYQQVTHRVLLPDVLGLGQWVRNKANTQQAYQPLKKRKRQSQERHFHDHFVERREPGGRFSWDLDTPANVLGDWLEVHEAPTISGLLVPRLGKQVATHLFYTAIEAEKLEEAYIRAWQDLGVHLRAEGVCFEFGTGSRLFSFNQGRTHRPDQMNTGVYVGAERVATQDYFQKLIGSLKQSVVAESYSVGLIGKHNEYTAYTWLFLAMASASRGVHHPFEHLDEAVELGSLHMHDKDYESGGQARVAFLPESVIQHVEGYLRWCQQLLQVMARASSATQAGFNRMLVQSRRQTLQPAPGDSSYPAYGSLFFLNADWHPEPASPKSVKAHLGNRHPLPINAQRHVLRSYLIEQRCPEAIIDAFMGHWDRGREPWASYSVMEPVLYRQQLLDYLEPLLERLGFEPLEPPGG